MVGGWLLVHQRPWSGSHCGLGVSPSGASGVFPTQATGEARSRCWLLVVNRKYN
ncbi:MAG: hypothetical protein ACHBN1_16990 [Heteroscytonema crispum UTEX LB 1556]